MEVVDRVINELRPLAEKLGEGAEHLWAILIKQMVIRGVVSIVVGVLLVTLAAVVVPKAVRSWKEANSKRASYWTADMYMAFWVGLFATIAGVIGGIHALTYGIPHLINPAFYALHEILRTIQ